LLNDWTFNQVSAEVTVPAGESVLLEGLTDIDSGVTFTGFKNVKEITYDGVPIHANSTLHGLRRKFMKPAFIRTRGEFHGKYFKIKPALTEDVDLVFYGTRWMDKYAGEFLDGFEVIWGFSEYELPFVFQTGVIDSKPAYATAEELPATSGIYPYGNVTWSAEDSLWTMALYVDADTVHNFNDADALDVATPDLVTQWENIDGDVDIAFTLKNVFTPFTGSVATDWLLVEGFEYMQWATICELNHLLEVYLPRTEGKLPPPDRQREESLESLMRWDTEMRDAQLNMKSR